MSAAYERYDWTPLGENDQKSIGVGDVVIYSDAHIRPTAAGTTFAIVRKVAGLSPHIELQLAEADDIVREPDGGLKIQRDPRGIVKQRVPWVGICNGDDTPRWNFVG